MASSRQRLIEAAFALFDERGFEETTVEDVAERAGVGRTTFFRVFKSKEDVIFPDHAVLLAAVRDRLATATDATASVAVTEAARLVLKHHLAEGDRARIRYRLTRSVPTLRAREIASQQQYQRTFREFVHDWLGSAPHTALRAELLANAVITAHNHVLRRWLRDQIDDEAANAEFDVAMAHVVSLHGAQPDAPGEREASLVVLRTTRPLAEMLPALREIAGHPLQD
ncbi:TetR family transcriptional regulator [Nocardioides sp. 616]|uniref:TetR family transcriptional regulator n=1 Tax=Nocardioides sp. 616 TaxID=2268090 RepID=UPI000CE3D0A8|nr:TetR family transcriptional regulator [Nocardioides sp. 616]